MRTRFVLGVLAVALFFATTASAQSVSGGVKGGVNFSTVTGDLDPGATKAQRQGFAAGGFVMGKVAPMVAIQVELLYSQEGLKIKSGSTEGHAKIDYMRLPLLLRLGRPSADKATGFVVVGPSMGFLMSAKTVIGTVTDDFKNELKSTDVSLVVGAGISAKRIVIEGRYSAGTRDVNKVKGSTTNKLRTISLLAGVHF